MNSKGRNKDKNHNTFLFVGKFEIISPSSSDLCSPLCWPFQWHTEKLVVVKGSNVEKLVLNIILQGSAGDTRLGCWVVLKAVRGLSWFSIGLNHICRTCMEWAHKVAYSLTLCKHSSFLRMQHKQSSGFAAPMTPVSVCGCQSLLKGQGGSWEAEFILTWRGATFLPRLRILTRSWTKTSTGRRSCRR